MATTSMFLKIDDERILSVLKGVGAKLEGTDGEILLDFSAVRLMDVQALGALDELARMADEKAIKVVIRRANIDVYKVLKLVKLARRFSFVN